MIRHLIWRIRTELSLWRRKRARLLAADTAHSRAARLGWERRRARRRINDPVLNDPVVF